MTLSRWILRPLSFAASWAVTDTAAAAAVASLCCCRFTTTIATSTSSFFLCRRTSTSLALLLRNFPCYTVTTSPKCFRHIYCCWSRSVLRHNNSINFRNLLDPYAKKDKWIKTKIPSQTHVRTVRMCVSEWVFQKRIAWSEKSTTKLSPFYLPCLARHARTTNIRF